MIFMDLHILLIQVRMSTRDLKLKTKQKQFITQKRLENTLRMKMKRC